MKLKYTGLTMGHLRDGMIVSVPTKWDTDILGKVEEAAWSEIAEALQRRGLYFSAKDYDMIFSVYGSFCNGGSSLNFWEEA